MQLSNFIDIITRAESCLEEREQYFLFALLDSYEELYLSRRATREEKSFWNQFWYSWDYPKLRDARIQAFEDIAADKYFHHITENRSVYRNFEKAVALDILRVRLQILYTLGCDFSDLHQEILYNLQSQVQQSYESNDLPPIITKHLVSATPRPIVTPKEVEISQSVKKEVASAVAASKKSSEDALARHRKDNPKLHDKLGRIEVMLKREMEAPEFDREKVTAEILAIANPKKSEIIRKQKEAEELALQKEEYFDGIVGFRSIPRHKSSYNFDDETTKKHQGGQDGS